jgi:hypothetical protein
VKSCDVDCSWSWVAIENSFVVLQRNPCPNSFDTGNTSSRISYKLLLEQFGSFWECCYEEWYSRCLLEQVFFWATGPYFGKSLRGFGITHLYSNKGVLGEFCLPGLLSCCNRFYIIFLHLIKYSSFLHIFLIVQISIFEIWWLLDLGNELSSLGLVE